MRIEIGILLPTYIDMMMDGVEERSRTVCPALPKWYTVFQPVLAPNVALD